MTSKTKSLGLALIAVFAIGAVTAQGAWGAEEFQTRPEPAAVITGELDGTSKDVLSIAGGAVQIECNAVKLEGTQTTSPSATLTITPTYGSTTAPTGCSDVVSEEPAALHTNHCAYLFHAATDAKGHAAVDIECEGASENQITVTIPGLGVTLLIGAQNGLKGVHFTPIETGGKKELTVHSTVTNIATTCSGFACIFIGGEHPTATYTGTEIIRGYEDNGSPLSGTAKTTPGATTEGAQVSVTTQGEEFQTRPEPAAVITGELDGTSKDVLSIAGGAVQIECNAVKLEGTQTTSPSATLTITPTYGSTTAPTGCSDVVSEEPAALHTNHCAYLFHAATDAKGHAAVDIECEGASENQITVTIPGLGVTLLIGAQNGLKGVHFTPIETGGKKELTVHSTVTNIATTCSGFACIFIGGEHPTATYTGTEIIRGYEDNGSPLSGTAKTTPGATTEGAQVSVTKE